MSDLRAFTDEPGSRPGEAARRKVDPGDQLRSLADAVKRRWSFGRSAKQSASSVPPESAEHRVLQIPPDLPVTAPNPIVYVAAEGTIESRPHTPDGTLERKLYMTHDHCEMRPFQLNMNS